MLKLLLPNMSNYLTKFVDYLKTSKLFIEVLTEKITVKAKSSGKSFKEYIYEDANINHISLVVYDILPLPLKLGIRYEKFNKAFITHFSTIREKLVARPEEPIIKITKSIPEKTSPKRVAKKLAATKKLIFPAKKIVKKAVKKIKR